MFDIEYALEADDPIIEWEITAHKDINGINHIVGQVVLKPEYHGKEDEVIEFITKKYDLEAVKVYDAFESSEVTGKRDFQKLKSDKDDYYAPINDEFFYRISYPTDSEPVREIVFRNEARKEKESGKKLNKTFK